MPGCISECRALLEAVAAGCAAQQLTDLSFYKLSVCVAACVSLPTGAEYEQVFLPCTNATDYCGYKKSSFAGSESLWALRHSPA